MVLERDDGQVVGVEAKARDTVTAADFRGLAQLRDLLGDQFTQGIVLHTGSQGAIGFGDRLMALPLDSLWRAGHDPAT